MIWGSQVFIFTRNSFFENLKKSDFWHVRYHCTLPQKSVASLQHLKSSMKSTFCQWIPFPKQVDFVHQIYGPFSVFSLSSVLQTAEAAFTVNNPNKKKACASNLSDTFLPRGFELHPLLLRSSLSQSTLTWFYIIDFSSTETIKLSVMSWFFSPSLTTYIYKDLFWWIILMSAELMMMP